MINITATPDLSHLSKGCSTHKARHLSNCLHTVHSNAVICLKPTDFYNNPRIETIRHMNANFCNSKPTTLYPNHPPLKVIKSPYVTWAASKQVTVVQPPPPQLMSRLLNSIHVVGSCSGLKTGDLIEISQDYCGPLRG